MNNKGADQTVWKRRLIYACIVQQTPKTDFLESRPEYIILKLKSSFNPFPASHDFCHLLMFQGSQYCKQYVPRSDCSQGSNVIWVHSVCFHDKIQSEVNLNICSRQKAKIIDMCHLSRLVLIASGTSKDQIRLRSQQSQLTLLAHAQYRVNYRLKKSPLDSVDGCPSSLTICMPWWKILHAFFVVCCCFLFCFFKTFRNTTRVSNSLDLDQAW